MSLLVAIKAEVESLEASLKANPDIRLVKLHELRRVVALYEGGGDSPAFAPQHVASHSQTPDPVRSSGRKADPAGIKALETLEVFLAGKTSPSSITVLYNHVVAQGIKIDSDDPKIRLSGLLHRDKKFLSHKRAGWTLTHTIAKPETKVTIAHDGEAGLVPAEKDSERLFG